MTSQKDENRKVGQNSSSRSAEKLVKYVKEFLPKLAQMNKTEVSYQELTERLSFPRKHSPQTHLVLQGPLIAHAKLCKLETSTFTPGRTQFPQPGQVNNVLMINFR